MKKNFSVAAVVVSLALTQISAKASGAILTFTNKAAFLASLAASPVVVDFEGTQVNNIFAGASAYGPGTNYGPGNVLTQTAGTVYSTTFGFGPSNDDGDTNMVFDGGSGGTLNINGVFRAVGFDVMNLNPPTANVFNLYYTGGAGSPLNVSIPNANLANNPPPVFFGAIGTAGELFTSIEFPAGNTPYFDNINLVPEPSSLTMLGLGVIGLVRIARRRRA